MGTIVGDRTVAQATSPELVNYGIPCGYKNYSAAYATWVLMGRRLLKANNMDGDFKGKEEIDGDEYHVEEEEEAESRPFKCILDVGIRNTSVGVRLWGALKGAADGGLHVPHKIKNFPGYSPAADRGGEPEYEAEVHKEKIFGNHVAKYVAAGIGNDDVEDMYKDCHTKIRENPVAKAITKKGITYSRDNMDEVKGSDGKTHKRSHKIGLEARRAKVLE